MFDQQILNYQSIHHRQNPDWPLLPSPSEGTKYHDLQTLNIIYSSCNLLHYARILVHCTTQIIHNILLCTFHKNNMQHIGRSQFYTNPFTKRLWKGRNEKHDSACYKSLRVHIRSLYIYLHSTKEKWALTFATGHKSSRNWISWVKT